MPEIPIKEVNKWLKELDNASLENVINYLEHDKIIITQNIAKKINSVNESDAINYMSGALSRVTWLSDTLKNCLKKEKKTIIQKQIDEIKK